MGEFGPWHLLIVAAVFVLLFGAKKLPDAARSLGRSARILKTELKDLHDEDPKDHTLQQTAVLPEAVAPVPVTAPVVTAPPTVAAPPVVVTTPATPVSAGDQTPAP